MVEIKILQRKSDLVTKIVLYNDEETCQTLWYGKVDLEHQYEASKYVVRYSKEAKLQNIHLSFGELMDIFEHKLERYGYQKVPIETFMWEVISEKSIEVDKIGYEREGGF